MFYNVFERYKVLKRYYKMLNRYLEKNIQDKLELFNILHSNSSITMNNLLSFFPLSPVSVNALIDELNLALTGLAVIEKNRARISISVFEGVTYMDLVHSIYQDSNVLQCLKYMILNDSNNSLSQFMEEHYVTKSSAYRIRENCCNYLEQIGLSTQRNKVIGEEYRIRFLIALLHYQYGIECYEIDDEDINFVRNFILITNPTIDTPYLETTFNEYGDFEYLFILSWKRKNYPNTPITSDHFEKSKELFVYGMLKESIKKYLEPELQITFGENDYDYFYLIYCSTNNVLFADLWKQQHTEQLHKLVFSDSIFYDLLQRVRNKFGKEIADSHALKAALIYFAKKFLLELQCLIPNKNFYLDSKRSHLTQTIAQSVSDITAEWTKKHNIKYEVDKDHIFYLSLQIELIIKQFMKPVPVMVLSELTAELEIISLYLERFFSAQRVTINPIQLDTESKEYICSQKNSVIVINRKFKYLMEESHLSDENIIVPITVELNNQELISIHKAIRHYENEIFLSFVNHTNG